jgi:hypothetical protein
LNNVKEVVKLLIDYPDSDSALAKIPHLYVCILSNSETRLLKCQSIKPYHLKPGSLPKKRFVVEVNPQKSPFRLKTLVDLDKVFISSAPVSYPVIGILSDELYTELLSVFDYAKAEKINI